MHIELNNKCKSLGGLSDLTVLAPIKKGLVPSLDSVTYKTRVRRLLEALQLLRESSHEYALFRPVSDSSERVGRIHSFRVAIVEPEDKLLLAVTFDGAQESYMRVLWQKIGTLLDLLFCSTEGYVSAYGHSLAEWAAWIDRMQVPTDFFYGRPGVTGEDVVFLRNDERERQMNPDARDADLAAVRRVTPSAEKAAWELANGVPSWVAEAARQGFQTVALLHRLTAWFIPNTPDGGFLHRAARDLLPEFRKLEQDRLLEDAMEEARERFDEQLTWFFHPFAQRDVPDPPTAGPDAGTLANIQGGILGAYENITHGALLLMAFKPRVPIDAFWNTIAPLISRADAQPIDGRLVCNLAITLDGLRAAGLTEDELSAFPLEFREGMAARCSVLGDFRTNHPRRWNLPVRNWHAGEREGEAVELSAVHVLVQLRIGNAPGTLPDERNYDLGDDKHPLYAVIQDLETALQGCMVFLSRQPLARHLRKTAADPKPKVVEHFGYADGDGQPVVDPEKNGKIYKQNLVHLGELLLGHPNAAEQAPPKADPDDGASWLADGTFLVVRKLRQDVAKFNAVLENAATSSGMAAETIAEKLMGRKREDGDPLAMPGAGNDFDYKRDELGKLCPLHAHIRRANPRAQVERDLPPLPPGGRVPRIMRRSMSYGPRYDSSSAADSTVNQTERGMLFMAYNASIAEQFEVIQRWLAGGNSTGGYSGHSDPLIGVPTSGQKRIFTFECPVTGAGGVEVDTVVRVPLDGEADAVKLGDPIVRLEWGMYLFTPSIATVDRLKGRAAERVRPTTLQCPWSARRGRVEIERLQKMQAQGSPADTRALAQAWKALLEDPQAQKDFVSASVWASIREDFGGVLRTPYGVVVASHDLVMDVLRDPQQRYTVAGYRERMTATIGDIFLGLDDQGSGCPYRKRSTATNQGIMLLAKQESFEQARELARGAIKDLIDREVAIAGRTDSAQWQLTFTSREVVDRVLEGMCQQWFGVPAGGDYIAPGAFRWDWDPRSAVLYPGNFSSPSRYIFQPNPGDEVLRIGSLHGRTLHTAFKAWVKALRDADPAAVPTRPDGTESPLGKVIFAAFPRSGAGDPVVDDQQDTLTAETMLGALIGFLPTVDGNLRQSLNEWLKDGSFWSLRSSLPQAEIAFGSASLARVEAQLRQSMLLRPAAELLWRQPSRAHTIGSVAVEPQDTIVVSVVSATHELLEQGKDDLSPIFGGARKTDPQAPTHACPGYDAAMGVMLGVLTALLEIPHAMRPAPTPLTLRLEGPREPVSPVAALHPVLQLDPMRDATLITAAAGGLNGLAAQNIATGTRAMLLRDMAFDLKASNVAFGEMKPLDATPIGTGHWLLLEGDSWFKYPSGALFDLADFLESQHKFKVSNLAKAKDKLSEVSVNQVTELCNEFKDMTLRGTPPVAILLSAGGNDVTREKLLPLVKPVSSGGGLNEDAVAATVDGTMRAQYESMLTTIRTQCRYADNTPVPVFLLGYDYPIPDGRNIFGSTNGRFAWLRDWLVSLGYDLPGGLQVMHDLIDRLNEMQAKICTTAPFVDQVFHADLRGTLSFELQNEAYMADWANELHPMPSGFEKLTQKLVLDYLATKLPALQ